MRFKFGVTTLLAWAVAVGLVQGLGASQARASNLKLEAELVWGTNEKSSTDHKPVETDVKKKLKELPLKWANYYEINRQRFEVPAGGIKKVQMSKQCALEEIGR